jgi:predicted MPP superfamily phosphohydrolase
MIEQISDHVWAGVDPQIRVYLESRLGRRYARQRLGIEKDHEAQVFGQGLNFFHIENLRASKFLIPIVIKMACLYGVGRRNANRVEVRRHEITSSLIPKIFDGYAILHLSDLHADISEGAMARIVELVRRLDYDLCVLTGDYRGETYGPFAPALRAMSPLISAIKGPIYAVLGNHDTLLMVPPLEDMGVRVLLNESVTIHCGEARFHLAGIDDAHFYMVDNIEKAVLDLPHEEFAILLSHTPEIYRQAAHADFGLTLCGHTHGGQICLPGGIPITLASVLPRKMGRGRWRYGRMIGYTSAGVGTSVTPLRYNCPAEITVHTLRSAAVDATVQ